MKFFLKSLLYSIFSPKFYKEASEKNKWVAMGIFVGFNSLILLVLFVKALVGVPSAYRFVHAVAQDFPNVTITKEGLNLEGVTMPEDFSTNEGYFVVDTTDEIKSIPENYKFGFLFNKNSFTIRDPKLHKEDKTHLYSEIFTHLDQTPVYFTKTDFEKNFYTGYLLIIFLGVVVSSISILFFNLFKIFIITLFGGILLSIIYKKGQFSQAFKIGIYTTIPITYINFLMLLLKDEFGKYFEFYLLVWMLGIIIGIGKWIFYLGLAYFGIYQSNNFIKTKWKFKIQLR